MDSSGSGAFPGLGDTPSALLARNWWAISLRGLIGVIFGLVALFLPGLTLLSLALLFAVYMLADGILAIVAAVRAAAHHQRWGSLVVEGVLNLIAGAIALFWPLITIFAIVILLGIWAILTGAAMIFAAFRLHWTHGRWLLLLSGILSLLWGVLLLVFPAGGAIVLTWWLGIYALIFGVFLIVLGFRLRSHHVESAAGGQPAGR